MVCRIKASGGYQPLSQRSHSGTRRNYTKVTENNAALENRVRAFAYASPKPGISSEFLKDLKCLAQHNIPPVDTQFSTLSKKDVTILQQAESKVV